MSLDSSLNFPDFKFGMDSGRKKGTYQFDCFRLDVEKLMLYRDDAEVIIPPKVAKTLVVLIENRGTILSKDELIDSVWSDAFVEESNLFQHLHRLRRVLGERPDGQPYIETFRRRGYRFNGDVTWSDRSADRRADVALDPSPARGPVVERFGNVLRFVDPNREPSSGKASAEIVKAIDIPPPPTLSARPRVLAGFAVLVILAAIGGVLTYRSQADRQGSANNEITFLRLTNGIKPVDAAISPNGDYFVYHELSDDGNRLWLQQVGQPGRIELDRHPRRSYFAKTFSPDGKFIYFVASEDANSKPALYSIAAIGGPQAKIVSDIAPGPVSFSPDGREMVFVRRDAERGKAAIVVANADGSNQRMLLEREATNLFPSLAWSPDGTVIVFAAEDAVGRPGPVRMFGVNPTSGEFKMITDERWDNIYRIAWTHDGRGLVMIATRAGEGYSTKRNQVYYLSYPGGESRRLTSDGSWHQEWSLGVTKDDAIIAIPFNRSSQIWSMDAGGDSATAIQISRGLRDGPAGVAPLPDDRVGFVSRSGEEINIWLMNADGSELKQLSTSVFPVTEELRADPKGRFFVFSAFKDGRSHLYRFDTSGEDLRQLTFGDGSEVDSAISPDGDWLMYHSVVSEGKSFAVRLFRMSTEGGVPVRFGDGECATPNYSPVGNLVSCIRGNSTVILSATDGSEIKIFETMLFARVNFGARWMPDGSGLVYIVNDKGFSNLWVQPLEGEKPRQLTNFTSGDIYNFAFSTDGTRLFLARGQQIADAILIRGYR